MISAANGEGIEKLVKVLYEKLSKEMIIAAEMEKTSESSEKSYKIYSAGKKEMVKEKFEIIRNGEEYIIKNARLERLVSMTNLENREALEYLKNRLKRMKIADRLKRMGIKEGSTVIIGNLVFELID